MFLAELKNFDVNRATIDELISLAALGRILQAEYAQHEAEQPEWIGIQLKSLDREIAAKNHDRLEARLREVNSRLESLKTPNEKKLELRKEAARIKEQLSA